MILLSRALSYGNYGILLIMGNAGFASSTVALGFKSPALGRPEPAVGSGAQ